MLKGKMMKITLCLIKHHATKMCVHS